MNVREFFGGVRPGTSNSRLDFVVSCILI